MAITMKPALLLFFALSCVTYSGFVSKTDLLETARQKPGGLDEDYIVYFLSQKHAADPRVCDPDMGLIKKSRSKLITGIIKSFEKQKIDGEVFVKCLTALTRELSPGDEETLQEDIQDLLESMLTDKMGGEGELNNFVSLNRYIFSMPQRFDLHAALKLAVDHPSRDPRVQEALKDFVESSEIYKGFYQKQKLDVTAIQNLKDSRILKKVLAIHPEGSIRKQARAQFVSLQVDESKHPLIVRNRQMAKDKILDKGYYAVEINDIESLLPKKDQTLELANLWIRAGKRVGTFYLMRRDEKNGLELLRKVDLKNFLEFQLKGTTGKANLCEHSQDFSIAPCVPSSYLQVTKDFATIDNSGVMVLQDELSFDLLKSKLKDSRDLLLEIKFREQQFKLVLIVQAERPNDIVFKSSPVGPDLHGKVEIFSDRAFIAVQEARAILELKDLREFRIVSEGGDGQDGHKGSDGRSGSAGLSGLSGNCFDKDGRDGGNGTDGSDGGNGTDGSPGGPGGSIFVHVFCQEMDCQHIQKIAGTLFRSIGGKGGKGGPGGKGGSGGQGGGGGHGASCSENTKTGSGKYETTSSRYVNGSSGRRGKDGNDGKNGKDGRDGAAGAAGEVHITYGMRDAS